MRLEFAQAEAMPLLVEQAMTDLTERAERRHDLARMALQPRQELVDADGERAVLDARVLAEQAGHLGLENRGGRLVVERAGRQPHRRRLPDRALGRALLEGVGESAQPSEGQLELGGELERRELLVEGVPRSVDVEPLNESLAQLVGFARDPEARDIARDDLSEVITAPG